MDSDNLQEALCSHEYQYLTCLSLEVHALTRADLRPDPEHDALVAVFYHITDDVPENWVRPRESTGCIVVDAASVVAESAGSRRHLFGSAGHPGVQVRYVADEHCLLDAVVELVATADPDILLGWEVQQLSWGYVLERAECLGRPLTAALSRLPLSERASRAAAESDLYGSEHTSEIHLAGRIVLNVWRLLRPEVALYSYTFENIAYHVLHQRVPEFSFRQLTEWWRHPSPVNSEVY
ncbi:DNA polymerase zeta catalytic subunit [Amphibalanus amphitrite]|uniref:DNA polymerase zeta catalytic subunit n=1 Tax=Amphibalanus amphitrite TaxID=1232801 RepID=A0A6A4V7X0_AMPAM|nr:DNA polymerase zeta catalytic subunit [Amphibalanus amphitrite]